MQILLVPIIIILIPITILLFVLYFLKKSKKISWSLKVGLGSVIIIVGLLASFYAMTISINGMSQKGIRCATGAVAFIPIGFIGNIVGVPLLLILFKNTNANNVNC
jgi:hypothetical protein